MTGRIDMRLAGRTLAAALFLLFALVAIEAAQAHDIAGKDAAFVAKTTGFDFWPFLYLGAKHMVTGYDHLLFLLGVIFFLHRLRQVALYVTLFSIGHSLTLLAGVLGQIEVSPYLVDAIIGLSVVYKAFDNLGGFRTLFGFQPNTGVMVLGFGLVHGFGLATKLQALRLPPNGLVANMLSFNLGVEIGQLIALSLMLGVIALIRRAHAYDRVALVSNILIMTAGFVLMGYQLGGLAYGGPL